MSENFKKDLRILDEKMADDKYAQELYSALCNMKWQNIKDPENIYSCTWRYAGGLVAQIRNRGEDYMDFYCSGNEGQVSERIEKDLNNLEWEKLEYEEYI